MSLQLIYTGSGAMFHRWMAFKGHARSSVRCLSLPRRCPVVRYWGVPATLVALKVLLLSNVPSDGHAQTLWSWPQEMHFVLIVISRSDRSNAGQYTHWFSEQFPPAQKKLLWVMPASFELVYPVLSFNEWVFRIHDIRRETTYTRILRMVIEPADDEEPKLIVVDPGYLYVDNLEPVGDRPPIRFHRRLPAYICCYASRLRYR